MLEIFYHKNYLNKGELYYFPLTIVTTNTSMPIGSGPVRNGYIFLYWNTASDGTGDTYYPGDIITQNLYLYAIWELVTYLTTRSTLTSIANAIRANNGESTLYSFPEGFISGIKNIDIKSDNKFIKYLNNELENIELSKIISVPNYAFYHRSNLTSISFPSCTSIGNDAFNGCSYLTSISFPACTSIGNYAFYNCYTLASIEFPACISIGSSAFAYCINLTSIYLNNSSICSLSSSNAFYSTRITSSTGSIYVPASLLTEYQSAPEWSYFSTQFVSIT